MKQLAAILLLGSLESLANANVVDLSGLESWDLEGDPDNQIFNIDRSPGGKFGVILGVSYDFTVQTVGTSWLSDVNLNLEIIDGWFHDPFWPEPFALGPGDNFGGTQRYTGFFEADVHLNPDGKFNVSLFESFDDQPDGVDAILLEGSTLTVHWFIPSPGTGAVFGSWGMLMARRRR
jgi:hypothetical protein